MQKANPKPKTKNGRRTITTTLQKKLFKEIQKIAIDEEKHANEMLDEGMMLVIKKYNDKNDNRRNQLEDVLEMHGK